MNAEEKEKLKEEARKISREGSWLCAMFQKNKVNCDDKQKILRRLFNILEKPTIEI